MLWIDEIGLVILRRILDLGSTLEIGELGYFLESPWHQIEIYIIVESLENKTGRKSAPVRWNSIGRSRAGKQLGILKELKGVRKLLTNKDK